MMLINHRTKAAVLRLLELRRGINYRRGVLQLAVLLEIITHHEWERLTSQLREKKPTL